MKAQLVTIITLTDKNQQPTIPKMNQTTIICEIEENIFGANVVPKLGRGIPNTFHISAWELISNAEGWIEKQVEPKENDPDGEEWYQKLGERLLRVCGNRSKFHTKACVNSRFPNGSIRSVKMTVFWDKPKPNPLDKEVYGDWTLRKIESGKRNKVLSKHRGNLYCVDDDLVKYLPDEAQDFECEPDGRSVVYFDKDNETSAYYEFRFQPKRKVKSMYKLYDQ